MRAMQWAPSGNMLDGKPEDMAQFIAPEGKPARGYGYGPGWSMGFTTYSNPIYVLPGQWVIRHDDGQITVADECPRQASPHSGMGG